VSRTEAPSAIHYSGPDLASLRASFHLHLRAENKSPKTLETYTEALDQLIAFVKRAGMPSNARSIRREHVEAFLVSLQESGRSPATVNNRYRSLAAFFGWLADEEEVGQSPMTHMRPPTVPEQPVPVLREDQLVALMAACAGRDFEARRDRAVLRLLIDTGVRRAELAGMRVDDVDLAHEEITVTRKGGRRQSLSILAKTARDLDRYMRMRTAHPYAALDELWLGSRGALQANSILQLVRRRGRQAGIPNLFTHQLRHTAIHDQLAAGASESNVMRRMGWRGRDMLTRYAASTADDRAKDEHRRLRIADRL
jgi:site-specific recombinase XerC